MVNTNIKTEEAKIWVADVEAELDAVKIVLDKTASCLEHEPDDDIWFEFGRIVKNIKTYWDGLMKVSKEACVVVKGTIDAVQRAGEEIIEDVKNTYSNMAR